MSIELRDADAVEQQWLALGSRGFVGSYLQDLGFHYSGRHYDHPLIAPDICQTFANAEAVLEYMVQHGIPNREALSDDKDKKALVWSVRCAHVDWTSFKNAKHAFGQDLKPEMTTRIVTDKCLVAVLKKNKVVLRDGRIYLAGATALPEERLVEGVHYATSLGQLRTMIRQTGSWIAPDTKPVGARGARTSSAVAEKLVVQLWAACGPTPLPKFGAAASNVVPEAEADDMQQAEPASLAVRVEESTNLSRCRRVSTTDEDNNESSSHSSHGPVAHPSVLRSAAEPEEEDHDVYSDSEGSLPDQAVPYWVLLKAKARGDKYKALVLQLKQENDSLKRKVSRLTASGKRQ